MKVVVKQSVETYLLELIETLFEKKYFSYKQNAIEYVDKITNFIEKKLVYSHKRKAPLSFHKYGKDLYYVVYKANQNTYWYIYFAVINDVYLICHIRNNYSFEQTIKK